MVSSTLTAPPSKDALMMDRVDELQVAHALREVACRETRPPPSPASQSTTLDSYAGLESLVQQAQAKQSFAAQSSPKADGQTTMLVPSAPSEESKLEEMQDSSPSNGLEALAALAVERKADHVFEPYVASSGVVSSVPSSSDEESDALAPPPPRRQRSVSNPEGMEKWDSLNRNRGGPSRRHFVLPESILEEELKEAQNAILEREKLTAEQMHRESDEENDEEASEGEEEEEENQDEEEEEEEEVDESMLTPEELLRKARSRLLEDLSEGTINGEKGELMLPHTLRKYKNVYNQNGRIGIYTPAERAAIIARFNAKRQRRVWNKKIRYNCRKSLADRRLRVKGRFVKRSEQEQLARELHVVAEQKIAEVKAAEDKSKTDADMPDVNDPEAGFVPTEDQPYRRLRRYTIT